MKKVFLIFALSAFITAVAQERTAHINLAFGASIGLGDYGLTGFDEGEYEDFNYPFTGGGADVGFNLGVNTTYYFTENIGLNVGYTFSAHEMDSYSRGVYFQEYWGSLFDRYEYYLDPWVNNTFYVGSKFSFPFLANSLFIDVGANIGFNAYTFPLAEETVYLTGGSYDRWVSGGDTYTALATKYDFGVRYFFGNFGIGLETGIISSYGAGNGISAVNYYYESFSDETFKKTSYYTPGYSNYFVNANLSLTYRVGGAD